MKIVVDLHRQVVALRRDLSRAAALEKMRAVKSCPVGRRLRASIFCAEEGQTLVEMAIALPVLLLLLTGTFSFGIAFTNKLTLTQAVGVGANYLQTIRTTTSDPCRDAFTAITNAAPFLDPTKVNVTVTINGSTPAQTGNTCSGSQSLLAPQVPVIVLASYPCNLGVYGMTFGSGCVFYAQETVYEY
jgi:Flp pilus assembly protein TadG